MNREDRAKRNEAIYQEYLKGVPRKELAKKYKYTLKFIGDIIRKKTHERMEMALQQKEEEMLNQKHDIHITRAITILMKAGHTIEGSPNKELFFLDETPIGVGNLIKTANQIAMGR